MNHISIQIKNISDGTSPKPSASNGGAAWKHTCCPVTREKVPAGLRGSYISYMKSSAPP